MILNPADATDEAKTKAKQTIDDISKKIQQGENFEALASQFSEDKSSAVKGGVLQRFGTGQLSSEAFENIAFSLVDKALLNLVPLRLAPKTNVCHRPQFQYLDCAEFHRED